MQAPRRSEKSHKLTAEERSRGGRMRAAKIYTAKAEAAAQGKPYKPLRRRRRSSFGFRGDPYARPASPEPVAAPEPEVELPGDDELAAVFAGLSDEEAASLSRAAWSTRRRIGRTWPAPPRSRPRPWARAP